MSNLEALLLYRYAAGVAVLLIIATGLRPVAF